MKSSIRSCLELTVTGSLDLATDCHAQEEFGNEARTIEAGLSRSAMNTAFGFDAVLVAAGFSASKVNAATGELSEITLENSSQEQGKVAVGEGAVWMPDIGANAVIAIDPSTNAEVGNGEKMEGAPCP